VFRTGSSVGDYKPRRRPSPKPTPPVRVQVPYAPTPTGRRAERAAARPAPTKPHPTVRSVTSLLKPPPARFIKPDLPTVMEEARLGGVAPSPEVQRYYGPKTYARVQKLYLDHLAEHENLKQPQDLINLVVGLSGVGDIADLVGGAAEVGLKEATATAAKDAASSAESKSLTRSLADIAKTGSEKRAAARGAVGRTVAKAEPDAVATARRDALKKLAKASEKLPRPVRVVGKAAGKGVTYPARHPINTALGAQVPSAAISGDPTQFVKALEGHGTFADISHQAAGALGAVAPGGKLAKQIVEEGIDLPASVAPSVFLTGKAGVEAAGGNSAHLKALVKQYEKTGLLPAVLRGDPKAALSALEKRPLYSGLEASGALSVAGRGAGALARGVTQDHIGGLTRPDLKIEGFPKSGAKRTYSRDLIRQAVQRLADKHSADTLRHDTRRGRAKIAKQFKHETVFKAADDEAIRKAHLRANAKALKQISPKKGVFGHIDKASADVVAQAVERIARDPSTFHEDLGHYKQMLEAARHQTDEFGRPLLDKKQLAANQALLDQVNRGIARANPEHVVESADAFIKLQQPILDELVEHHILAPDQAAKASAIPFARVHMGAGYKEGLGVVDRHGRALGLARIQAEMDRHGVRAPGFISHRPPSNADFYRPHFGGASLEKGVRTGESVATGSHLGGAEALKRQLARSQGLLDRAKAWNSDITRWGVEVPGVDTMKDAQRVIDDPERYGFPKGTKLAAVPRHPFGATKGEMMGALEHQDPEVAGDVISKALHESLDQGIQGKVAPDSRVVLFPKAVAETLRDNAQPSGIGLRRLSGLTSAYKRNVLPFSPTFQFQVPLDNWIKTGLAGVNPFHMLVGRAVAKDLSPEERASILHGSRVSEIDALSAHRRAQALYGEDKAHEVAIRSVAKLRAKPGFKQIGDTYSHLSNWLLRFNATVSETLPEYGVLGKLALHDARKTQHSWTKAVANFNKLAQDFAKKQATPDELLRTQEGMVDVLGNWTRMKPSTRKVMLNLVPFGNWIKNAMKFVYVTMPAHHPIQTAILTAASRMTEDERKKLGLDIFASQPVPKWLRGNLPMKGGGLTANVAKYSSFGFAANPFENIAEMVLPLEKGPIEDLSGVNWKGEQLGGSDLSHLGLALGEFATAAVVPGYYTAEGLTSKGLQEFNPLRSYPGSEVRDLRKPTKQITVPATSGSSGGSWSDAFGGSSSSSSGGWSEAFGGG
jgi:hypothetical protein